MSFSHEDIMVGIGRVDGRLSGMEKMLSHIVSEQAKTHSDMEKLGTRVRSLEIFRGWLLGVGGAITTSAITVWTALKMVSAKVLTIT